MLLMPSPVAFTLIVTMTSENSHKAINHGEEKILVRLATSMWLMTVVCMRWL